MWKHFASSRRYAGLVLLSVSSLLVGCHGQRPFLAAASLQPQVGSAATMGPVQQSPEYRASVRLFARRDYPAALAGVDALLRQPLYQNRPADLDFLRQQQVICRHAVDPHATPPRLAASVPAPMSPATPRLASQADCGPRALLLLCPELGVHTTLDTLRKQAGTKAAGTSLAGLARAAQAVGLKAKGVRVDKEALSQLDGPAVAWVDGNHYVAPAVRRGAASYHSRSQSNYRGGSACHDTLAAVRRGPADAFALAPTQARHGKAARSS